MKSWKKRVTVARKELCKAISATNGEAACKSSLFSNKKNKIELYVYTLCDKACTPYFKGKKIEIDEKDCKYAKPPKPGPVPPVEPDPVPPPTPTPDPPPDVIVITNIFDRVCNLIKSETKMYNRKQLCLYHLFKKRCENVKGLLCPEVCNDKKVIEAQRDGSEPTKMKEVKSILKQTDTKRKDMCKQIKSSHVESFCHKPVISNKKNNRKIRVYMLCEPECKSVRPKSDNKNGCKGYAKLKPTNPPSNPDDIKTLVQLVRGGCNYIKKEKDKIMKKSFCMERLFDRTFNGVCLKDCTKELDDVVGYSMQMSNNFEKILKNIKMKQKETCKKFIPSNGIEFCSKYVMGPMKNKINTIFMASVCENECKNVGPEIIKPPPPPPPAPPAPKKQCQGTGMFSSLFGPMFCMLDDLIEDVIEEVTVLNFAMGNGMDNLHNFEFAMDVDMEMKMDMGGMDMGGFEMGGLDTTHYQRNTEEHDETESEMSAYIDSFGE